MTLYAIQHDLRTKLWCGPAAVAAVTGRPTSEIVPVLRLFQRTERIQGVSSLALQKALRHFGFAPLDIRVTGKRTLASVLDDQHLRSYFASTPAVITTTGHFQVVEGRRFIDSHTRGTVALRDAPGRRQRVVGMIALQPTSKPSPFQQQVDAELAFRQTLRSESRSQAGSMARARALAGKLGITLERDRDAYWVTEPARLADHPDLQDGLLMHGHQVLATPAGGSRLR